MFRFASLSKKALILPCKVNVTANRFLATYKTSTGLAGLSVDPHGRETLQNLSDTILSRVQKIPETSQYRIDVEKWFSFIKKVTTEKDDVKAIENEIDRGQIEEVIQMAKDELELIDYYHEHKIWEKVEAAKLEGDEILARMADSVYFTNPEARPQT
eukprot:gene7148-7900_t